MDEDAAGTLHISVDSCCAERATMLSALALLLLLCLHAHVLPWPTQVSFLSVLITDAHHDAQMFSFIFF